MVMPANFEIGFVYAPVFEQISHLVSLVGSFA